MYRAILFLCFHSVLGFLKVVPDETFGGFEFKTTKYSEYIGDFDEDCQITAQASILQETESICDTSTVQTSLRNTVFFNVDTIREPCAPETAHENAERLGALAFVDVFNVAPGVFRYSRSIGKEVNRPGIPFIQTGTEFLEDVIRNDEAFAVFLESSVELSGCNDESVWKRCYDTSALGLDTFTGLVALAAAIYSTWTGTSLARNPASLPRIFLLKFIAGTLYYTAFIYLFGLFTNYHYPWLTQSFFPDSFTNFVALLLVGLHLQVVVLAALYWSALRVGIFRPDAKSVKYWNSHFFKHPVFGLSFIFCVAITLIGFFTLEQLFEDTGRFEGFVLLLFFIQVVCALYFSATVVRFIFEITSFVDQAISRRDQITGVRPTLDCSRSLKVIAGFEVINISRLNSHSLQQMLYYTKFLSRWLLVFCGCLFMGHIFVPLLFFVKIPLDTLQDDEDACKFVTFFGAYNLFRCLSTIALVIGISWQSRRPEGVSNTPPNRSSKILGSKKLSLGRASVVLQPSHRRLSKEHVSKKSSFTRDSVILQPSRDRPSFDEIVERKWTMSGGVRQYSTLGSYNSSYRKRQIEL